ncbi:DUF6338 family protein [Limimaricola sp. G21655-S1]|nr:DUF6338 family protein [Limimaricola sp. G21655-S1]MCZ4260474.1 DUF6338 family protein [Limimaricola sp. G21655-S1]
MDFSSIFDIGSIGSLLTTIAALAPGFIIAFVRSKFVIGGAEIASNKYLEFLISSSVYYSAVLPFFLKWSGFGAISIFFLFFGIPLLIGAALGISYQKEYVSRIAARCNLKIAHPVPTAWDYVFSKLEAGTWVVVTLKNYEDIYGYFGGLSFASSDLERRDIYIQDVRDYNWNPVEEPGRARGVWISEDDIVMVQFVAHSQ